MEPLSSATNQYLQTLQRQHEFDRERQQSRTILYRALRTPIHIDVLDCPRFDEDDIEGIELDSLETFVDLNYDRIEYGKSPHQKPS